MTNTVKKPKIFLFTFLTLLVLLSNYVLYHAPVFGPIPQGAVLGSLLDFLIVIPLITYFFIIRKRYSLKYMGFVILAAYGAAYLIIPNQHFSQYSFVPYIIIASESLLVLLELYILYKVIVKLPKLVKDYRRLSRKNSYFLFNVKKSVEQHLPGNRMALVFVTEFTMFYYSLFSWKKKTEIGHGQPFTYHKKTSVNAVYIMLIHAIAIESIGLHYFLHQWNSIVSYILLALNIYSILYFLAELHATRLTPFLLTEKYLLLQSGFSKSMHIPLEQIQELKYYDGPEKFSRKEQDNLYDARVMDLMQEKPMFEINLKEPQELHLMYGMKRKVKRIVLNVDEPSVFYTEMSKVISA